MAGNSSQAEQQMCRGYCFVFARFEPVQTVTQSAHKVPHITGLVLILCRPQTRNATVRTAVIMREKKKAHYR